MILAVGNVSLAGSGSIDYPIAIGLSASVPAAPAVYNPVNPVPTDLAVTRSPMMPSVPVPVNFPSLSQPPVYQPSALMGSSVLVGTVPVGGTVPIQSHAVSGIGGSPPPPPTEGFVPSHGIVTATPGKVSR